MPNESVKELANRMNMKLFKYVSNCPDDTTIILTHPVTFTSSDSSSFIHSKMKCMEDWSNRNYLSLNKLKIQIMYIKKNLKCILSEISQSHVKILVVIINNKLKWDEQVTCIVKGQIKIPILSALYNPTFPNTILSLSTKALFYQF